MDAFRWDSTFATGLDEVDRQHHHLVDLINTFSARMAQMPPPGPDEVAPLHDQLKAYASYHFQEEERLMAERGLDRRHVAQHEREHADFLSHVAEMLARAGPGAGGGQRLLEFLVHWLTYHILGSDQSMARQVAAIAAGHSAPAAFDEANRGADAATSTLLRSVTALFEVLSVRNRELSELAQSLEARVEERTRELSAANAELQVLVRTVEHTAMTDALTGLPNRRFALARLATARSSAARHLQPLTCMLIDADGFKAVNDEHGHEAGDGVLQALAACIRESVRGEDDVCRLGGDEFLVVCPQTPLDGAHRLAERVRAAVAGLHVRAGDGAWHGSVSVGVAAMVPETTATATVPATVPEMAGVEALLRAADAAVYLAKRRGRNRVEVAESPERGG